MRITSMLHEKRFNIKKNLYGIEDGPREIKKNGLHHDSDKRLLNLAINKLIISHFNKGSVSERGIYTPASLSQLINKTKHKFWFISFKTLIFV